MNLLTILFSSIIHIILVLVFEGVFLFAILIPIINRITKPIIVDINQQIYNNFDKSNLPQEKLPQYPSYWIYDKNIGDYIRNPNYDQQLNDYWDKMDNFNDNTKDIFTPSQKTILKYGVVDETGFINQQINKPYIMYGLILLVLVTSFIIIIIISKKYNIYIDYKFSMINSIIVFFLICGYAGALLWYSVFSQSYVIDINKKIFKNVLDIYNSS
jgi:hypothetical protein